MLQKNDLYTFWNGWCAERIISDQRQEFSFLKGVPSSEVSTFVEYYSSVSQERFRSAIMKASQDARSIGTWSFQRESGYMDYQKKAGRFFKNRPSLVKHTMGVLLKKTGVLPPHMIVPDDDVKLDEIRGWADSQFPSRKDMLALLKKCFKIQCLEAGRDGAEYAIWSKGNEFVHRTLQTNVVIATKTRGFSYSHRISLSGGSGLSGFTLNCHSVRGGACSWDMMSVEKIDQHFDLLVRLVADTEDFTRAACREGLIKPS